MEKFPEIKEGQAVLIRAEASTGHVVDESFKIAITDTQKVYTIYNSVEEALHKANEILKEKKYLIECVIYGEGEKLIYYLNPYHQE